MKSSIIQKKKRKKRRWKHPLLARIKLWFSVLIDKFSKPRGKSNVKLKEEKETFIQGLIRINTQAKAKSNSPQNIRELVPYKMYKARDLLLELQQQKETLVKTNYRRNNNIN